jgi:bifunctional enzyme CysN/CysC
MADPAPRSPDVTWHESGVSRDARWSATGAHGATVWLTGLSGSGKSTIASVLLARLVDQSLPAYLLDGDNVRHGLNGDLGFSSEDRAENVRRIGEVARLFADAGVVAIVPVISPFRAGRDHARRIHADAGLAFVEVFVDTPLSVCEDRDPKGLYARARAGELRGLTGVDDPYEPPVAPELVIAGDTTAAVEAAARIAHVLAAHDVVPRSRP